jgi:pilus assembly protein CpaD
MLRSFESLPGRRVLPAVALAATVLVVAACNKTPQYAVTGSIPNDYRERHPIRLTENDHTVHLLVGTGTGVLTAEQRAQVSSMASAWRRQATGHLLIETPKGTANSRTAAYASREAQSILRASGVPPRAIIAKSYDAEPSALGPVRLGYLRIEAEAGPCGLWPEDIGASLSPSLTRVHPNIENQPYYNFGCSTQQNLAAMIEYPEDLVQPRASTPPYAARRQTVMEKYRKGEIPSGQYDTKEAEASSVGQ